MPAALSSGAPASLASRAILRLSIALHEPRSLSQKRSLLARSRWYAHARLGLRRFAGISPTPDRYRVRGSPSPLLGLRSCACKLKKGSGESDRSLSQITWCVGLTSQDCKDIARFESGPMPRPTGCDPSDSTNLVWSPNVSATLTNARDRALPASRVRTFAVGPTGTSITRWVEPAAIFFEEQKQSIALRCRDRVPARHE